MFGGVNVCDYHNETCKNENRNQTQMNGHNALIALQSWIQFETVPYFSYCKCCKNSRNDAGEIHYDLHCKITGLPTFIVGRNNLVVKR